MTGAEEEAERRFRERIAAWMLANSFATGHGDTVEDLLSELVPQIHERAAWQAAQVLAVLEPFARKADSVSLSDALGHIERAHLMAARDLVAHLRRAVASPRRQLSNAETRETMLRRSKEIVERDLRRERDRYKALAEGERERIATMFEDIEEERAARHVRKFSAPSLEDPTDARPGDGERD